MTNPRLTISIAIDRQRARGEKCLHSLLAQTALAQIEIIIFDFAPATVPNLPSANHPQVRVIRPQTMMGLSDWRYLVMTELARGEWVAFIEEHCTINPEWADGIFHTADTHPQVAIITPEVCVSLGGFWNDYTTRTGLTNWLYPMKEGIRTDFFVNNCAFLRHVMLELGESFRTLSMLDHALVRHLNQVGYVVYGQPACKIVHENEKNPYDCLRAAIWWRWSFTAFRSQTWRWWVKLAVVAYTPLAPFVRTYRSMRVIQRGGMFPTSVWEIMRLMLTIFVFRVVDAIVQVLALVLGMGKADSRFLWLGMNPDRV